MSKSSSGRVVVDISPELKQRLYAALAVDSGGLSMKDWFCAQAEAYLAGRPLSPPAPPSPRRA